MCGCLRGAKPLLWSNNQGRPRGAKPLLWSNNQGRPREPKPLLWSNNQGHLRGAKPLFYNPFPLPLIKGKGDKVGDGVNKIVFLLQMLTG